MHSYCSFKSSFKANLTKFNICTYWKFCYIKNKFYNVLYNIVLVYTSQSSLLHKANLINNNTEREEQNCTDNNGISSII